MGKFAQALAYLLPQGAAWPREPGSVLMRVLQGMAGMFEQLHAYTQRAAFEWMPHATRTRLEEWEEATGLPDPCFGPLQAFEARRSRLLARLRGPSAFYFDSSPAAPGSIEAVCLNLGLVAQVRYNAPFRCGRDRVGHRVGQLDGKLYVLIQAWNTVFRVGRQRVGQRLIERPAALAELVCALTRYVPARFELHVIFI